MHLIFSNEQYIFGIEVNLEFCLSYTNVLRISEETQTKVMHNDIIGNLYVKIFMLHQASLVIVSFEMFFQAFSLPLHEIPVPGCASGNVHPVGEHKRILCSHEREFRCFGQ